MGEGAEDDLTKLSHAEKDALILALLRQLAAAEARIAALEARLAALTGPAKTPDNSSKPPSQGQKPDCPPRRSCAPQEPPRAVYEQHLRAPFPAQRDLPQGDQWLPLRVGRRDIRRLPLRRQHRKGQRRIGARHRPPRAGSQTIRGAYRLKAGNADQPISTSGGTSPFIWKIRDKTVYLRWLLQL